MFCPKVIAHRGANQYAPQNTLPAFRKAIELGANGIETDVHVTKDGQLVICHNYSVDEMSNGLGTISQHRFQDLKKLDFGSSFSRKFKGVQLPSLDEFLEICKCDEIEIMNLELKSPKEKGTDIVRKTLDAVEKHGLMHKLLISSFDYNLLREAKELNEDCKTGFLYPFRGSVARRTLIPPVKLVQDIRADAIHPHRVIVTPYLVQTFHNIGVKVNPWTVNTKADVLKMLRAGVDCIITDRPSDVREIAEHSKF